MNLTRLLPSIEIDTDITTRLIYATDASVYREIPAGVIFPKNEEEIQQIVAAGYKHKIPLIARGAGTSLAGQVVGVGYILDMSRYMNRILELNVQERSVLVEPGVILDQLNVFLKPHGLFFGPETSTSSRCTIGGMVGNNSCGSHSLMYFTTREHLLEATVILSDASKTIFKALNPEEFEQKLSLSGLEGNIYRTVYDLLIDSKNRKRIEENFPDKSLYRRNSGYALDLLAAAQPFSSEGENFNLCKILAGSEGTLAIATRIKLNLVPLPPQNKVLVCAHFNTLEEALKANLVALKHQPGAVELMDRKLLEAATRNITQQRNRFFIEGNPEAILAIEMMDDSSEVLEQRVAQLIGELKNSGFGYHFPIITGNDISRVWALRKAGLGVLTNIPGDAKPVTVIEDTAVPVEKLPDFIADLKTILEKYQLECVYHAHIGSGELHLRPVLNLKDSTDRRKFRTLAFEIATLVKKYRGSLSGEHGDGRLRSELLELLFGKECIALLERVKLAFDPHLIFNPGKKVFPVRMDESLRYKEGQAVSEIDTWFDFSSSLGFLRAVEMCNGSADCRKDTIDGGFMCPTYMATRDEKFSTRARANLLREVFTRSSAKNPFDSKEIYQILDMCIACKACKSECPSNIDMAKFKSEFLWHYHLNHGISIRTRIFMYFDKIYAMASLAPRLTNFVLKTPVLNSLVKKALAIAPQRNLPLIAEKTFTKINLKNEHRSSDNGRVVYLYIDEFTNYSEPDIGIAALRLLQRLGYDVKTIANQSSGRTYISKGNLKKAFQIAQKQIETLYSLVTPETPLLGIEPSAILSFRDEYPDLLRGELQQKARKLYENCLLIDEFLAREYARGTIRRDQFDQTSREILLHVHCQQKSLITSRATIDMLKIPENHRVSEINSGCCGMAGAFGYEKEHYELSMKIGEQYLFPAIRKASPDTIIAANGTSCRQQIYDGTRRKALHPVEIMALAVL